MPKHIQQEYEEAFKEAPGVYLLTEKEWLFIKAVHTIQTNDSKLRDNIKEKQNGEIFKRTRTTNK